MNITKTKAVILLAGDGGRLLPYSGITHKSLLMVHEKPLLWYSINNIRTIGISDIILVVGYKADQIKKFTEKFFPDIHFTFVFNKHYLQRNSIYSFYCASPLLYNSDFFRLAGDLYYNKEILIRLIESKKSIVSAVEQRRKNTDEDFAVSVNQKTGTVIEYGKHISATDAYGIAQGIDYVDKYASPVVIQSLNDIMKQRKYKEFPEYAFQKIIDQGDSVYYCDNTTADFWCDVDTPKDLEDINMHILGLT